MGHKYRRRNRLNKKQQKRRSSPWSGALLSSTTVQLLADYVHRPFPAYSIGDWGPEVKTPDKGFSYEGSVTDEDFWVKLDEWSASTRASE